MCETSPQRVCSIRGRCLHGKFMALLDEDTSKDSPKDSPPRGRRFVSRRSTDLSKTLNHERIRELKCFAGCCTAFLDQIIGGIVIQCFSGGEVMVKEGGLSSNLYLLIHGEAEVTVGPESTHVETLIGGSFFGESALMNSGKDRYASTVLALKFCDCRVIHKHYLQRILQVFPEERARLEELGRVRVETARTRSRLAV